MTRRPIACLLLPCYLAACTSWQTQELAPEQVLAQEQPDQVRVTLSDGQRLELRYPAVHGDTLTGMREARQVAVPLERVSRLELREADGGKTLLLVGGVMLGTVIAAGAAFAIGCAASDCW